MAEGTCSVWEDCSHHPAPHLCPGRLSHLNILKLQRVVNVTGGELLPLPHVHELQGILGVGEQMSAQDPEEEGGLGSILNTMQGWVEGPHYLCNLLDAVADLIRQQLAGFLLNLGNAH